MKYIRKYNEDIEWDFDYEEENHNNWDKLINLLDNNDKIIVDIHKNDIDRFNKIISEYGKKTFYTFYTFYDKLFKNNKHPYEDIGHVYIEKNLSYMPLPRGYVFDEISNKKYNGYIYLDLTK